MLYPEEIQELKSKLTQNTSSSLAISSPPFQEQENVLSSFPDLFVSQITQFKKTIDHEIEHLKHRKYKINEPESSLDLLIQRYQSKKSAIGSVAHWYGEWPLWKKIFMGLVIGAIGAGVGFLCNAPIVLGIVSVVCYLIFAFICIDHYRVTNKQIKLLSEDILELEKSLNSTVKLFNEFSEKLHQIYLSSYALMEHFASNIKQMEKKVETLNLQLAEYQKILNRLSESEKTISTSAFSLAQTIEQCENEFHSNSESLHHESNQLSNMNAHLVEVHKGLEKAVDILCEPQLYERYLTEYKKISETTKKMQIIVDVLKNNPHLQVPTLMPASLIDSEMEEKEENISINTSRLIKETDDLIHQSATLLTTYDMQNEAFESIYKKIALEETQVNISIKSLIDPVSESKDSIKYLK